jgi:hypothetical protein
MSGAIPPLRLYSFKVWKGKTLPYLLKIIFSYNSCCLDRNPKLVLLEHKSERNSICYVTLYSGKSLTKPSAGQHILENTSGFTHT